MTQYNPPDPNRSDIVDVLEYEARYIETAIAVGDECTENYALMCLAAANEIKRLRAALNLVTDVSPANGISEIAVQQQLRVHAPKVGAALWRNNNGACMDDKGRMIRYGLGNDSKKLNKKWKSSDLVGIAPGGQFLAVEVKEPGWYLTPGDKRAQAQLQFMKTVVALGGKAGFATSTGDLERIINEPTT